MSENYQKPLLRFKGFTDAWEQYKLGNIGKTYTGLSGKTAKDFGHGTGKYVTYMNVFTNPISNLTNLEPIEIDNKQNEVRKGDIFFTTSSETPHEVGMSSVWLGDAENIYLNSFCFGYRPTVKNDSNFMGYILRSPKVRKDISLLAQGISRFNISKTKMMDNEISLPAIKEQTKIGELFRSLDNLITLHQRKYDKLVNTKKALLETMFPKSGERVPKLRFKGFADAWEQRKIKELASITTGKSNTQDQVIDGMYPFYIRSETPVRSNKFLYDEEAVITIGDGQIGKVFHYVNGRFDLHQRCYKMANFHDLSAKYFYYYFSTFFYDRAMQMTAKATVDSIRLEMISEMEIKHPVKLVEQTKIEVLFSSLDNLITLHQRKYNKLINIKKALLQKMFV